MTKRIFLALAALFAVSGAVLAASTVTAQPAAACGDPHTS